MGHFCFKSFDLGPICCTLSNVKCGTNDRDFEASHVEWHKRIQVSTTGLRYFISERSKNQRGPERCVQNRQRCDRNPNSRTNPIWWIWLQDINFIFVYKKTENTRDVRKKEFQMVVQLCGWILCHQQDTIPLETRPNNQWRWTALENERTKIRINMRVFLPDIILYSIEFIQSAQLPINAMQKRKIYFLIKSATIYSFSVIILRKRISKKQKISLQNH